jgi:uncharacterized protein
MAKQPRYLNTLVTLSPARNNITNYKINHESMIPDKLLELTKTQLLDIAEAMELEGVTSFRKAILISRIVEVFKNEAGDGYSDVPENQTKAVVQTVESVGSSDSFAEHQMNQQPSPPLQDTYDDVEDLPWRYNQTKLVFLIRDPYCIYGYWDINEHYWQNLPDRVTIQLYDITDTSDIKQAPLLTEAAVDHVGTYYFTELNPNRKYRGVLGFYNQDNSFQHITESNEVALPRDSVSDDIDLEWYAAGMWDGVFGQSGGVLEKYIEIEQISGSSMRLIERHHWKVPEAMSSPGAVSSTENVRS